MNRPARSVSAAPSALLRDPRDRRDRHCGGSVPAIVVAAWSLAFAQGAMADVNRSGDVSPPFAAASAVNLAGQQVFIGNTSGGVGGIGTVNVTGGGILTAAQIVAGTGGLGTGFVNVTGPGSTIRLTGGGANNGLDIGSWGTGIVTVASGGSIACASTLA